MPRHTPLLKREFVSTLVSRLNEPDVLIQVILGPRQVGKTTGVQMALNSFKKAHYVTADDSLGETSDWITQQWQEAKLKSEQPLLVIDEVQKIQDWPEKIKALWDSERLKKSNFRLVLLGSSSLNLAKGLDESLTGRFETILVHHWSFTESRKYFGFTLEDYLVFGGYPAAAKFKKDFRRWQEYLKHSIIDTVVGKDILRMVTVKKPALFRQSFDLLSSYPSQLVSYNKLLGQLQDHGNVEVIKYYIELFEGAYLFRTLQKYSGSEIQQKASSPKIIPLAPSLYSYKHSVDEARSPETFGFLFESAVGAELAKLPGKLYYWREKENVEVDFVYVDGKKIIAIEVKSGRRKSSKGLAAFQKKYPKADCVFITLENFEQFTKDPELFLSKLT